MKVVVYGISTCDTCRKARAWLSARSIAHDWVDLREHPLSRSQVGSWVSALSARALRNTSGGSFRALGVEKEGWDEARWTDAFVRDPMLIKRPVLEIAGKPRAVGFRPAAWEDLLGA